MAKGKNTYKTQEWLSFLLFLSEVPNFVIVVTLFFTSGMSLVMGMDLIDSAGNLLRALFVFLLAHKLRKDLRYKYNYGVGKIEAMSSLVCDTLMLVSIATMIYAAVMQFIEPQQPSETLGFAVIFKVFCVAGDLFMFFKQRQICKKDKDNLVLKAELSMRIKNVAFDGTTLIAVILLYFFRTTAWIPYFSPAFCILLAIWLIISIIGRVHKSIIEIVDKTAPEDIQKMVLQALTANYNDYDSFESVHSHVSGGIVFIDLDVRFEPDTPYEKIQCFVDKMYNTLKAKINDLKVSIQINNTPESEAEEEEAPKEEKKGFFKKKKKKEEPKAEETAQPTEAEEVKAEETVVEEKFEENNEPNE